MARSDNGSSPHADAGSGPPVDTVASLLGELSAVVPNLIERTAAELELGRRLLSGLACPAGLLRALAGRSEEPDEAESADTGGPGPPEPPSVPAGPVGAGATGTAGESAFGEPPPVDSLAIPGYDSLAASQVVPRLTTLGPDELRAVGAYEATHRHRQTILNRVTQLLAD